MQLNCITIVFPTSNEQQNFLTCRASSPSQLPLIVVDTSQDAAADLIKIQISPTQVLHLCQSRDPDQSGGLTYL